METRNKKIKDLVFCSGLIALMIIMTITPLGYIRYGGVEITVLHLPVMIGAIVLGKKYGLILGFTFGITSLIKAFELLGPFGAPFTNPLLSVVPRVCFGLWTVLIYNFLSKKIKNQTFHISLSLAISSILHSLVVLALLFIIGKTGFYFEASDNVFSTSQSVFTFIIACFGINGLIELAFALLVGTPIILVLKKIRTGEENELY